MAKKRVDHYEVMSKQITDLMEAGECAWTKPWITQNLRGQCNGNSKRPYTGMNALVLAMVKDKFQFESSYWLTASKAFGMGLKLEKGSRGVKVLGWFKATKKSEETGEDESTGNLFVKTYSVFNFSQFTVPDGVDVPKHLLEKPKVFVDKFPRIQEAELLVESIGANVEYGSSAAYYVPMRDKVYMPDLAAFKSVSEFYSTLFHELTHWTGNEKRLKRFKNAECPAFRSEKYSAEELTAELGSVFICSFLDISSETSLRNSSAYLKGWLKYIKSDPKAFVFACQRASKAADYILDYKSKAKVG